MRAEPQRVGPARTPAGTSIFYSLDVYRLFYKSNQSIKRIAKCVVTDLDCFLGGRFQFVAQPSPRNLFLVFWRFDESKAHSLQFWIVGLVMFRSAFPRHFFTNEDVMVVQPACNNETKAVIKSQFRRAEVMPKVISRFTTLNVTRRRAREPPHLFARSRIHALTGK